MAIGEGVREFYRRQGELRERSRIVECIRAAWWQDCECRQQGSDGNCFEQGNVQEILDLIEGKKTADQVEQDKFESGVRYALQQLEEVYGAGLRDTDLWNDHMKDWA